MTVHGSAARQEPALSRIKFNSQIRRRVSLDVHGVIAVITCTPAIFLIFKENHDRAVCSLCQTRIHKLIVALVDLNGVFQIHITARTHCENEDAAVQTVGSTGRVGPPTTRTADRILRRALVISALRIRKITFFAL